MWESPINAIYEAQQNAFDGAILSAVMKVGIDVNKEELIKALAYDRQQYEKGYADAKAEIVRCRDCKRWNPALDMEVAEYGVCQRWSQLLGTKGDDFCSRGERRTYEL